MFGPASTHSNPPVQFYTAELCAEQCRLRGACTHFQLDAANGVCYLRANVDVGCTDCAAAAADAANSGLSVYALARGGASCPTAGKLCATDHRGAGPAFGQAEFTSFTRDLIYN